MKLDKWKTDLKHSDLMGMTHLRAPKVHDNEPSSDDGQMDRDDEVDHTDEEDVAVGTAQTEGHCEFVDGELHMVNDEAECREE